MFFFASVEDFNLDYDKIIIESLMLLGREQEYTGFEDNKPDEGRLTVYRTIFIVSMNVIIERARVLWARATVPLHQAQDLDSGWAYLPDDFLDFPEPEFATTTYNRHMDISYSKEGKPIVPMAGTQLEYLKQPLYLTQYPIVVLEAIKGQFLLNLVMKDNGFREASPFITEYAKRTLHDLDSKITGIIMQNKSSSSVWSNGWYEY